MYRILVKNVRTAGGSSYNIIKPPAETVNETTPAGVCMQNMQEKLPMADSSAPLPVQIIKKTARSWFSGDRKIKQVLPL